MATGGPWQLQGGGGGRPGSHPLRVHQAEGDPNSPLLRWQGKGFGSPGEQPPHPNCWLSETSPSPRPLLRQALGKLPGSGSLGSPRHTPAPWAPSSTPAPARTGCLTPSQAEAGALGAGATQRTLAPRPRVPGDRGCLLFQVVPRLGLGGGWGQWVGAMSPTLSSSFQGDLCPPCSSLLAAALPLCPSPCPDSRKEGRSFE